MTGQESRLLRHRAALTNMVRRIALEAGEIILDHFDAGSPVQPSRKEDGSPVTQADRDAEALIVEKLYALIADVPVIGEEMTAAGLSPDIAGRSYFWLVDALDGTGDFIAGGADFTVNIALIHDGAPVLGVVYAPAAGELYAGYREEDGTSRALRWMASSDQEKDIRVRRAPRAGMTVLVSKNDKVDGEMESYLGQFKVEKILKRGSSLKFCLIAAGKADLYPRLRSLCAWDTAAGDAVLRAAGGQVCTRAGQSLHYSGTDAQFRMPPFIAAGDDMRELP